MNEQKAFVVSALKYRPQTFVEVTGQDHINGTLKNAVKRKRLANAYLFCGPRGVGKTSSARILAKAMNCEAPAEGEPCNECAPCLAITGGKCLDVLELDAASNRGIDEVRDLRDNVRFAPSSCKYKVYIIDEAHQLTKEAFNALLKTLEEPPPHAKFILATTEADKMPDTIVSRCQQYRFKPLPFQQIVENLRRIAGLQETCQIPDSILEETLFLIAKTSDGGMRDAQSLFDQVMSLADETLTLDEVELVLGGVRLDTLIELTESIRTRNVVRALELVHSTFNQGQDMGLLVRDLVAHFRNLLVCRSAPDRPDLVGLPLDQTRVVTEQSKTLAMEDLLQGMDILFESERRLRIGASSRAVIEAAVIRMAKMATTVEIEALLGRREFPLQAAPASPESGPAPAVAPPIPEPAPPRPSPPTHSPPEAEDRTPPVAEAPPPTELEPEPESEPEARPEPAAEEPVPPSVDEQKKTPSGIHIQMDESPDQEVLETLLDKWERICHATSKEDVSVGGYLADAIPRSYDDTGLEIALSEGMDFHHKQLNDREAKEVIRQVLRDVVGVQPEIRVVLASGKEFSELKPPVLDQDVPSPAQPRMSADEVTRAEPAVQQIVDRFDGVVIEVRNNPNR